MAINLRSALAHLTDSELAERYHQLWTAYEQAKARPTLFSSVRKERGPVRHPRLYRFLAVLKGGGSGPIWFDLLMGAMLSHKFFEPALRMAPDTDAELSVHEIQDVMDEMQRRVDMRKGQTP